MLLNVIIPQNITTEEQYIEWYEKEVLANMYDGISSHILHD